MYPAYLQWRSHPIKISLTFVDKTPGARNQMQRPDVYLQVERLILWTCHRYVFHISQSLWTVNWNSYTSIECAQVYNDITSISIVLYGIPGYLLVPRKIRWLAMIYSCLLSRAIVKISENTNSSWPDDVYMCHGKQQHSPYSTYIEWNRYVILKFSSQAASKVVSCDAHMRTRIPFSYIN